MLIYITVNKFLYPTKKEWKIEIAEKFPDYEILIVFLEKRCRLLEKINYRFNESNHVHTKNFYGQKYQKEFSQL